MNQREQYELEAAKWNPAIIQFVVLWHVKKSYLHFLQWNDPNLSMTLCWSHAAPVSLCVGTILLRDSSWEKHPRQCCTVYVAMVTGLSGGQREGSGIHSGFKCCYRWTRMTSHGPWRSDMRRFQLTHVWGRWEQRNRPNTSVCQQLPPRSGLSDEVSLPSLPRRWVSVWNLLKVH